MSDSEVKRLEERIEASNREFNLRLEAANAAAAARLDTALARIDGKFDTLTATMGSLRDEVRYTRAESRTHFYWIIGIIVPLVLAVGLGLWQVILTQAQNDRAALSNVISAFSAGLAKKADEK